jgi:hypothetical protein
MYFNTSAVLPTTNNSERERERAVNEAQWAEEIEQGYCAYTY